MGSTCIPQSFLASRFSFHSFAHSKITLRCDRTHLETELSPLFRPLQCFHPKKTPIRRKSARFLEFQNSVWFLSSNNSLLRCNSGASSLSSSQASRNLPLSSDAEELHEWCPFRREFRPLLCIDREVFGFARCFRCCSKEHANSLRLAA